MSATDLVTVAPEIQRDRWGRPLIAPPDGSKPVAYTRATTLAGTMDDLYGLMGWKVRTAALGLADRPDLQLAITTNRGNKKALDKICEQALEAGGATAAATIGTALHTLTEQLDRGEELPTVPDHVAADVEAYRKATAQLEHLAIEQFTVCDELQVAGTPDRIVRWQGGNYIADLKTGQNIQYGLHKIALQLAIYSRSVAYDTATGQRTALPDVNQSNAIVIHAPAGSGKAELLWINISAGWDAVDLAMQVRSWRKAKNLSVPFV